MSRGLPFSFDLAALRLDENADHVVVLPAGINGRGQLFEVLRSRLQLPPYFGNNWDALEECLRDLSWVEKRRVAMVHEELPRLETRDLAIYLEVLADSVRDWKPGDEHELLVVFPPAARFAIVAIYRPVGG